MEQKTLENRVDILERAVEGLAVLPERVAALEGQILQLRVEMRAEFSSVRADMRTLEERMGTLSDGTLTQMRVLHEEVLARIALLDEHRPAQPLSETRRGARQRKPRLKN